MCAARDESFDGLHNKNKVEGEQSRDQEREVSCCQCA